MGIPIPFPHLTRAGFGNAGPPARVRGSSSASSQNAQDPCYSIQEGLPGLQRGPKAAPPRPTDPVLRSDRQLTDVDSKKAVTPDGRAEEMGEARGQTMEAGTQPSDKYPA